MNYDQAAPCFFNPVISTFIQLVYAYTQVQNWTVQNPYKNSIFRLNPISQPFTAKKARNSPLLNQVRAAELFRSNQQIKFDLVAERIPSIINEP